MTQVETVGSSASRENRAQVRDGDAFKGRWSGRRSTLWLVVAALILPFGWILPVAQLAWIRAKARRERNV